jgi:hypothetical protein
VESSSSILLVVYRALPIPIGAHKNFLNEKLPQGSQGLAFPTSRLDDAAICGPFACQVAFFHIFLFFGQNMTEVI